MPESENRAPQSVYDAEAEFQHDEPRSGRRRRPVADWGGDELFTRMPRRRSGHVVGQRRFARADADHSEVQPAARHDGAPSQDWDRAPQEGWDDEAPRAAEREPVDDWGLDPAYPAADREARRTGAEPGRTRPEPPVAEPAPSAGGVPEPAPADQPAQHTASALSTGGVPGRRTVMIGRAASPHREAPFSSVSRRRPPRTLAERIGGQPDRIVGWAFVLGLILILVAVATAHV